MISFAVPAYNEEGNIATTIIDAGKAAKLIAEDKVRKLKVSTKNVTKYLGPIKISSTLLEKKDEIGMSTGLAWTEAGGDILFIEVGKRKWFW